MAQSVDRITSYCSGVSTEEEFATERKTYDACLRNLQVLGDASGRIPASIQKELKDIPWKELKGLRNILVHEYFGVSPSVIWNTIKIDLPKLKLNLDFALQHFDNPIHPWRICPPGEIYIRPANVQAHLRVGHEVRAHLRREHCREIGDSGKDTLTPQEVHDISNLFFADLKGGPEPSDLGFKSVGNKYDILIRGWTRYWNEVFAPKPPLDPDFVKALIASESSFKANEGKGKKGVAKGLMQLLPATIRYLNGEQNELRDHLFLFQDAEVYDPNLSIAAGIRWLFRKRETATARLKRLATWDEAIEEYKDYLRLRLKNPKVKNRGMGTFHEQLEKLKRSTKESN